MKEVNDKRVAGPFKEIPFEDYMQSPIGLVPKAEGKTRMIFHLSYDFKLSNRKSLNACTPEEMSSVKYHDLDTVMDLCIHLLCNVDAVPGNSNFPIWFSKTDLQNAFRLLPVKRSQWQWLVFKAKHPENDQYYFFVDKCVPFGASRSCMLFQSFSDALKHMIEYYMGKKFSVVNYLDNFLFISLEEQTVNKMVSTFIKMSFAVGFSIAE